MGHALLLFLCVVLFSVLAGMAEAKRWRRSHDWTFVFGMFAGFVLGYWPV